jgi:hypothetical protein
MSSLARADQCRSGGRADAVNTDLSAPDGPHKLRVDGGSEWLTRADCLDFH